MASNKKKIFNLFFLFIFVFFLTSKIIRLFLPNPTSLYAKVRSEKLEMLRLLGESTNLAITGTSRIGRGFNPIVFDDILKKNNINSKSINLGLAGGGYIEQIFMAKEFFRSQLKASTKDSPEIFHIFELTSGINFDVINFHTSRAINLYDYDNALNSIELSVDTKDNIRSSLTQKMSSFYLYILNLANTSFLSNRLFNYKKEAKSDLLLLPEYSKRGYLFGPNTIDPKSLPIKKDDSLKRYLFWKYPKIIEIISRTSNLEKVNFAFIVTPVLIYKFSDCIEFPSLISVSNFKIPIFNFSCPKKYPELYNLQLWSDPVHLNFLGSQKFSALLAEEFTKWIKEKDQSNAVH